MALTDAVVRQAKTTGKDYTLTDADGLLLFVSGKGRKNGTSALHGWVSNSVSRWGLTPRCR